MAGENLVVTLTIHPGESFSGSISVEPGEPALAFSSWLGFFEAINAIRQAFDLPDMGKSPDAGGERLS